MGGIAVVHLARRKNGLAPFDRFVESYRAHPAGVEHDLVIILKGFPDEASFRDHHLLLEGIPYSTLLVPDTGFDLNAYFLAVERLDYDYFCFLNSFSQILDDHWLEKLHAWITRDDVGLVGATGSAQSIAGGYTPHQQQMNALPPVTRFRTRVARAVRDRDRGPLLRRATLWALRSLGIWRPEKDFPAFPNYHLRTNAFMGARGTLRRVHLGPLRTKLSAYRFESSRNSLTNQVLGCGLKVLVVGSNGEAYEPEQWHSSNTFWQSLEENLLVSDNQTQAYLNADPASKARFAQDAWGASARPS